MCAVSWGSGGGGWFPMQQQLLQGGGKPLLWQADVDPGFELRASGQHFSKWLQMWGEIIQQTSC